LSLAFLESGWLLNRRRKGEEYGAATPSETAKVSNLAPSPGLRELYLEVVNQIHPDRASNESDLTLREHLMKEANAAFQRDDTETLRCVLDEYRSTTITS
jgi:hypothetical protein